MSHEQLWAPWRLAYVANPQPRTETSLRDCFLCRYVGSPENDTTNWVLARSPQCVVVLNRFPYNNGHLLVAPRRHVGDLTELTAAELLEGQQLCAHFVAAIRRTMQPQGFNLGLNLGEVAGAGLPGHLHWHIVPRWGGDTNFMSVCSDVRVIPQALDALRDILHHDLVQHPLPEALVVK